ncbi:TetR/AcrR family transcriptional regulator [Croceicoccus sediminis]|uniref:TetR/AcrR family transcriptional regulator n=1 Tax=Croceicoccus sediminis TaxID=2571150 RepID=UPI001182DFE2|nr:TetR/AcrR family transcriptional regulator [Croceicoccus sediminis]
MKASDTKQSKQKADDDGNVERRRPYARTFDKRRREILSTAWTMIAEAGGSEFTLQELSERCDVALRTIYNAFGDKDGVVAAAAAAHHSDTLEVFEFDDREVWSLSEAICMTRRIAQETVRFPGWSQVTSEMYFSPRGPVKLFASLQQMPTSILRAWLRSDQVDLKLLRAFGQQALEASHADAQWGVVANWCAGRIDEAQVEDLMVDNFLVVAMSFGNRAGRSLAKKMVLDK